MKETIHVPPSARIIRSWREDSRISLEMVVKELIDNSFDAHASTVKIDFSTGGDFPCYWVKDNGTGIVDIKRALRYGDSRDDYGSQRLGRFGIALKKGPARTGYGLYIRSNTSHLKTTADIHWRELERDTSGLWPIEIDTTPGQYKETGTEITVYNLIKHRTKGWEDLPAKLAKTFAPALKQGKQILFNGVPLVYRETPGLTKEIQAKDETASGLVFNLRAGLMETGHRANNGIDIRYGHRVLVERWVPNFLSKYATGRLHAEVTLVDGDRPDLCWSLNNFKDDIDAEQKDELATVVHALIQPLLQDLEQQKLSLRIGILEKLIEGFMEGEGPEERKVTTDKEGDEEDDESRDGPRPPGPRRRRKKKEYRRGRLDNDTPKKRTAKDRLFEIEFDTLNGNSHLWIPKPCEPLIFTINLAHPRGPELKKEEHFKELVYLVVLGVASYLTTRPDAGKYYPFLLNGTQDLHVQMCENASRWLEKAEIMLSSAQ